MIYRRFRLNCLKAIYADSSASSAILTSVERYRESRKMSDRQSLITITFVRFEILSSINYVIINTLLLRCEYLYFNCVQTDVHRLYTQSYRLLLMCVVILCVIVTIRYFFFFSVYQRAVR